jgi:proteasome lid subunit RPN8/RPN11
MRLLLPRDVFESCLLGAANSYPNEFLGLFPGRYDGEDVIVEKLYLAPLSEANSSSVWFDSVNVPLSAGIVGTFHSHPNSPARPSSADLHLFGRYGRAHLIASGPPYSVGMTAAFSSKGKPISFVIL